jgi:hypothetical protein
LEDFEMGGDETPEGVFIEGKPLAEYLADLERDEKSHEVEELRKGAEVKFKRSRSYVDERQIVDTRKVSRRVRHLTDRQIREEYGLMEKPFQSHGENAIWAIWNRGPVSVREIGEIIEWKGKDNSLSAMVATVWSRLGDMHEGSAKIMTRESKNGRFYYMKAPGLDMSTEAAIEKYKLTGKKQWKAKNGKKVNSKKANSPIPDDRSILPGPIPPPDDPDIITETIQKVLGVKVSGRIEIVFKWEK